jgi:hypothetical protein
MEQRHESNWNLTKAALVIFGLIISLLAFLKK